jgi:hypothetical protein
LSPVILFDADGRAMVWCSPPRVCPTCKHLAGALFHYDAKTTCPGCPKAGGR